MCRITLANGWLLAAVAATDVMVLMFCSRGGCVTEKA
jgi:hypothetical protein